MDDASTVNVGPSLSSWHFKSLGAVPHAGARRRAPLPRRSPSRRKQTSSCQSCTNGLRCALATTHAQVVRARSVVTPPRSTRPQVAPPDPADHRCFHPATAPVAPEPPPPALLVVTYDVCFRISRSPETPVQTRDYTTCTSNILRGASSPGVYAAPVPCGAAKPNQLHVDSLTASSLAAGPASYFPRGSPPQGHAPSQFCGPPTERPGAFARRASAARGRLVTAPLSLPTRMPGSSGTRAATSQRSGDRRDRRLARYGTTRRAARQTSYRASSKIGFHPPSILLRASPRSS